MLFFLLGTVVGGLVGIFLMCLLQVNRREIDDLFDGETDFEKSTVPEVDNTAKKA